MNRQYVNVLIIFLVALLVEFGALFVFMTGGFGGFAAGIVVTLVVLILALALIRMELKKRDAELLKLILAVSSDGKFDRGLVRAGDPVDEAVSQMYDAAHERNYWYESILNTIPFGISVTDMDMRWTFCNKAALESMNKTAAECLGRPCCEKNGNLCNTPNCGIEQLRRGISQFTNTFPSGKTMLLDLHYLVDSTGKRIGHVEISKDITEEITLRREAKDAARKAREEVVQRLSAAGDKLQNVAATLMSEIEQVKNQTAQASSRLAETATAMEEMNSTVLEVAKNAENAAQASQIVHNEAETGADAMEKTVADMKDVQTRSLGLKEDMVSLDAQARGIGEILTIIRDIADQTNLLALNAAIEAARAGDAGRGFAVVADEVRKLAEKTMASTSQVGEAIKAIQESADLSVKQVETAVRSIDSATELAGQSGNALEEIVKMTENAEDQVRAIAAASEQQSASSEEINKSVTQVTTIAGETARAMEEAAKAVSELAAQAQILNGLVNDMRRA